MARSILLRTSECPYNITARVNNKEWFYAPAELIWDVFCEHLSETQQKYNLEIHAFLMMSNHIHLMCSTPEENIDKAMHYFMMMSSRSIGKASERINRIWGSQYYRCIIGTDAYYAHAFRYLHSNPIRANIVTDINSYKWSTFDEKNYSKFKLLVKNREGFDQFIPDKKSELESWVNTSNDPFYNDCIRRALRKPEFKFSNNRDLKIHGGFEKYLPKK